MKRAIVFILFFFLGICLVVGYKILTTKSEDGPIAVIPTPQEEVKDFSIEPPPIDSLKGNISNLKGDVFWISRIATDEAKLTTDTLQQGESIRTSENGSLNIDFPTQASIKVDPKTHIDFVQTLPVSFVLNIASGSATIKKQEKPVTVRAMRLLIRQNGGEFKISLDEENSEVNIDVISGSITTSYNDLNFVTHTNDFGTGKIGFNDATRSF